MTSPPSASSQPAWAVEARVLLAEGVGGRVWRARWNDEPVVVKQVSPQAA